jgi:hypothetical protein
VRLALVATLAALAVAAAADAQRPPPLAVQVAPAGEGHRPRVSVAGVLDDEGLRRALEGGLPLRFSLRAELWRKGEPFDRLEGAHEVSRALVRAALSETWVLEDGRRRRGFATLADAEAALEAALAPPLHAAAPGRYYYLVRLSIQTLSGSDLDELRHWLRGEAAPAVSGEQPVGRAVERGARRIVVRLLRIPARRYEARTPVFRVR